MKRSLTVALCLFAAFLPACGTTSTPATTATTPTATTQSSLTFTSTVTGSPVAGAKIVVAGSSYTTGADGVITLSAPAAIGSTVDATAPGFLDRATAVTATSTLTLWQIPAGADVNFVRQLAYSRTGTPEVLWRPTAVNIFLQLVGELGSDPVARAAHVQAAAMATAMTGARVTVQVGTAATAGLIFTLQLNPASSTTTTFLTQTGGTIQGGRVEYPNLAAARNPAAIAHEIGHMLGFGHAPSGLMCPSACGAASFSPLDQAVFVSMWQRLPGTAPLDNDRRLLASSDSSTAVFNCDIR
jgi:hypothetical protein